MIRRLGFLNYRSHRKTEFALEPLTVFIGPVASGKSNVFRGLVLLQNSMIRTPGELFGSGPWAFWAQRYRNVDSATAAIGYTAEVAELPDFQGDVAKYELQVAEGPDGIYVAREELGRYFEAAGDPGQVLFRRHQRGGHCPPFGHFAPTDGTALGSARPMTGPHHPEAARFASAVADNISRYGYFHLEAGDLGGTSSAYDSPRRLGYNGRDLPAALAWLREAHGTVFAQIEEAMRELLPGLRELLLVPVGADELGIGFQYEGQPSYLAAPEASDGTLFTLGLLTVLMHPEQPAVLALEEPETGLHPSRLRWLMDKLWDLSHPPDGTPPTQILISTHSPYLLDLFKDAPEVVRIVEMVDGATRVRSLPEVLDALHISPESLREDSLGRQWHAGVFEEAF